MADPTIAGCTVTLLEITSGKFSAVIEDETLDSGSSDVSALGAKAFYLILGGTFSDRDAFFTMLSAIDIARANMSTIAIANVDATLDGNYYVLDYSFERKQTNWIFNLQLVKSALYTGSGSLAAYIEKAILTEIGDLIYASAVATPAALAHGAAGQLLTSGGHGAALSWTTVGTGIDHGLLSGLADDDHPQYIKHALAVAINDFIVASGAGVFVKKTLAEVLTILGKAVASGLASLDAGSLVIQNPANATATPTISKIPISDASGLLDSWISAASLTLAGKIEVATAAETTTGTDAGRAVSPDGFAESDYGKRIVQIVAVEAGTALAVGDGKAYFIVPVEMNGWNLVRAEIAVDTVSSSGLPTVQIRNATDTTDMLSTKASIDVSEYTSYTAATPSVVDGTKDDVVTGDKLAVDVDIAGTGTKGLIVILTFQLP